MGVFEEINAAARGLVGQVGAMKRGFDRRIGKTDQPHIVPSRGYGNEQQAFISGRVLLDPGLTLARHDDAWWRNLLNTYKRIESDEIPGARLSVRFFDHKAETVSDAEGFFRVPLPSVGHSEDFLWNPVQLELVAPLLADGRRAAATGHVMIPPKHAQFGVISDLDDTVIRTEVTSLLRMLRTVILENARTRLPFPGVAAFYQALQNGKDGTDPVNPIFYVSSSPWNLYDLLEEFLVTQSIPAGPLILRDWGLGVNPSRSAPHKIEAIGHVFDTLPTLPFILIGDSGQEDPEIYRQIIHRYPARVRAVYIRNVTSHPERSARIRTLIDEVQAVGSTMLLTDDTLTAARHAAEHGWIHPQSLDAVAADQAADRGQTDDKKGPPATSGDPDSTLVVDR